MAKQAKNTICLWYEGVEDAAGFYAEKFPDSFVGAVSTRRETFHRGRKGTC